MTSALPTEATSSSVRELVRPGRLVVHLLVALAVVTMIGLGVWQLRVALPVRTLANPNAVPVPLNEVSTFGDFLKLADVGVVVAATGQYDASKQVVAAVGAASGPSVVSTPFAVLTPLVLPDGTAVAVLRGGVEAAGSAPAPPDGQVRVVGPITDASLGLRVSIPSAGDGGLTRPLSTNALLSAWKLNLRDGVVVLSSQQPASTSTSMTPPDVSAVAYTTESGVQWRNALYSVQWWVFALFTAYLYIRYLLDTLRMKVPQSA